MLAITGHDMSDNILAGLVSGLLVTFLVVVVRTIWYTTIIPWFENRVYKDVLIEGRWFSLYPTVVGERQETVSLERHGHEVSGSIICNSGSDEGEKYNVHGSFRNMILSLIYENADKAKVDRGTITLKCINSGERLSGQISTYHHRTDSIISGQVIWFRTKEDQEKNLLKVREQYKEMKKVRQLLKEAKEKVDEFSKSSENNSDERAESGDDHH